MTNQELKNRFINITINNDNIFDIYCSLSTIEKDYRTTDFYKIFKKSIYEAYDLYSNNEGKVDRIIHFLNDTNEGNGMDRLILKLGEVFDLDKVMNEMEGDNRELFKQVLGTLQK